MSLCFSFLFFFVLFLLFRNYAEEKSKFSKKHFSSNFWIVLWDPSRAKFYPAAFVLVHVCSIGMKKKKIQQQQQTSKPKQQQQQTNKRRRSTEARSTTDCSGCFQPLTTGPWRCLHKTEKQSIVLQGRHQQCDFYFTKTMTNSTQNKNSFHLFDHKKSDVEKSVLSYFNEKSSFSPAWIPFRPSAQKRCAVGLFSDLHVFHHIQCNKHILI